MQLTRHFLILALVGLLLPAQAQTLFKGFLNGRSEAQPVATQAFGEVDAVLNGNELVVTGSFSGLEGEFDANVAGGAHLHLGYAGENGPVSIVLTPTLSTDLKAGTFEAGDNTFMLDAAQLSALNERRMYVNIHTTLHPGGEIRGQLLPDADALYYITLSGSNEVPAVVSGGSGALALEVDGDQLTVTGSFAGLDGDFDATIGGGAHLHLGLPGENGPVSVPINATTPAGLKSGVFALADNTFTLTEEQLTALANRMMYANIHTTAVPSGELRGQAASAAASNVFRAHLSGANEVPAVTSYAAGVVHAEVIGDSLVAYGAFTGLESPVDTDIAGGAHLHLGMAGTNGPVAFLLASEMSMDMQSGAFMAEANGFVMTGEQREQLYGRGIYVNIHTLGNQGGELRGQLLPEAQAVLTGVLGGGFEAPPINTRANGTVKAELRGNMLTVSGSFSGLSSMVDVSILGGAHLHLGLAGSNGPVAFPLAIDFSGGMTSGMFRAAENTFMLSSDQVAAVLSRGYYVNIHTLNFGGGELRGQLLQEARYYMNAVLSGTSEVPAVRTPAFGQLLMEVESDSVVSTGSFAGLQSMFDVNIAGGAHLHDGLAGQNGPIFALLNTDVGADGTSGAYRAEGNTLPTTEELRMKLRSRALYVNIHTTGAPSGELRGQTLPFSTAYFTTSLDAFNEVPVASSGAVGGLKLELNGDQLTVSGAFSGMQGAFDTNIAGGAHLHLAPAGENGGVDLLLSATLGANDTAGIFAAAENTFTLEPGQILDLEAGNYYANLHTTAFPGGELRGQILREINFFPSDEAVINFPPDGASLALEGGATTTFAAVWEAASDNSPLAYVWEVALDEDFENIVFQANTGADTAFTADFQAIDGLLESLGVAVGQEVAIYHRAVATDGAVAAPGPSARVNLTRGEILDDLFESTLTGHNEALPIATTATGFVSASLSGNELTVSGAFEGLSSPLATEIVGGAHLHLGFAGQNGPVLYPLNVTLSADSLSGAFLAEDNVFEISDEEAAQLRGRQVYVNIHSGNFQGGELRGQLVPVAEETYTMSLFGSNEVPSIVSSGAGALVLDISGGELTVTGSFAGLDGDFDANIAGGAHLHVGLAGQNGGIELPLTADLAGDLKSGVFRAADNTFELTTEQEMLLANRALYANIHTTAVPSGELRGQLVGEPLAVYRAHLSGSNEVPVVTTMAGGAVVAELMDDSTLVVSGSFAGLESPLNVGLAGGAHIHLGLPGTNGDIELILNITADGDTGGRFLPENNTFTITPEQRMALMSRAWYVNIHSIDNAPGEIRGQLMLESQAVFTGFLSGIFEVPEAATSGLGAVQAELSGTRLTVAGSFNGLGTPVAVDIAGGAHIHQGLAGATGGIVVPLALDLYEDELGADFQAMPNTFTLTTEQVDLMKSRGLYVNIHSEGIQTGELRAQILPEARTYFYAPLSGASEVPAANTPADGAVALEVNPGRAVASGTFNGLSSMLNTDIAGGAHIHLGYAGQNGPVVNLLASATNEPGTDGTFSAAANTFMVSEGWVDTLRMRRYYVNVHSADFAPGEVRGQLLPLATAYFTNSLAGFNEVQPAATPATGAVKAELTGNMLVLSGGFSGLTGEFDEMVAGGAHLHIGGPGENGGVDITLVPTLDADELGGAFEPMNNAFMLTADQAANLRGGSYYVNIHTTTFPSGELRGQVLPEINRFPSDEALITSPADGAELTIEGDPETPFAATWSAATDRDEIAYVWQLAADEDFQAILVEQNVGSELTFETTFGVVDQLLEGAGLAVGESITLYHRAVASDGSVAAPGAFATVVLARGMIVNTLDLSGLGLSLKAYPTVAHGQVTVELGSSQSFSSQLMIADANGRMLEVRPVDVSAGTVTEQLDVAQWAAGTYFIQWVVDGQLAGSSRFIVAR